MTKRIVLDDAEHNVIYGAILDLREDFIDLKRDVFNDLDKKANKGDINLWLLWRQSPVWMKSVATLVLTGVLGVGATAIDLHRIPLPF